MSDHSENDNHHKAEYSDDDDSYLDRPDRSSGFSTDIRVSKNFRESKRYDETYE